MDLTVRPFTPADRPAGLAMRVDAFTASGKMAYPADGEIYIPDHRRLGAFTDDARLVAQACAWDLGQWFLGRRLPMAGVAAVTVQPDMRRRGLASRVIRDLLDVCVEQGDVIATLDPAAPQVYRRLGWAFAGVWVTRTIPTAALQSLPEPQDPPTLRPFRWEEDVPDATALWRSQASTQHGRADRSPDFMRRILEPDDDLRVWVAERDGVMVGVVEVVKQESPAGDRSVFEQVVMGLSAVDRDTWLSLWRLVGAQASVCASTILLSRPHEPLLDELSLSSHQQTERLKAWMTRLLDVSAAVSLRGWPAGAAGTVDLRISDPLLARNDGSFTLSVAEGEGHLEPGGSGRVALGIDTMSAMFTGHVSASTARWQGRIQGSTSAELTVMDELFASPQPYLHDHY